jgi:light-regulated signal transduction histidine kinase (bacteriophytochrome)
LGACLISKSEHTTTVPTTPYKRLIYKQKNTAVQEILNGWIAVLAHFNNNRSSALDIRVSPLSNREKEQAVGLNDKSSDSKHKKWNAAQYNSLFEPFYTTKDEDKGSNMGPSMVHGIVHNHGSHILLHSKPGEGCTFTLLLPPITDSKTNKLTHRAITSQ